MWFPQTIRVRGVAALLAMSLGGVVPAAARAEPAVAAPAVSSPWDEEDRAIENAPCSPEDRRRALELLAASILLRSPYENTTPIVVQPPVPKTSNEQPKKDNPGPTPQQVPEPASLLTGAVGSGLALLGWLRHRRRRPVGKADEKS